MSCRPLVPPLPRGPGRPKDPGKREAILAAAGTLFLQRGFGGVTMEAVAAEAGVSKMTVYGHFRDKDALFEEVIKRSAQRVFEEVDEVAGNEGTLEEVLVAVGRSFLRLICNPAVVAADRALVAALAETPALARRFYQAGPGHMTESLARVLLAASEHGELAIDDAVEAAGDLLSLWAGHLPKQLALRVIDPVGDAQIERRVARTTRIFLRAYAV